MRRTRVTWDTDVRYFTSTWYVRRVSTRAPRPSSKSRSSQAAACTAAIWWWARPHIWSWKTRAAPNSTRPGCGRYRLWRSSGCKSRSRPAIVCPKSPMWSRPQTTIKHRRQQLTSEPYAWPLPTRQQQQQRLCRKPCHRRSPQRPAAVIII